MFWYAGMNPSETETMLRRTRGAKKSLICIKCYCSESHAEWIRILNGKVEYETNFQAATGKAPKYLKDYVSDYAWNKLLKM